MSDAHPIRNEPVRLYHCPEAARPWRAFFGDGRAFPVFFDGATPEAAEHAASAFRADVLAKHEAAYIARRENIAKARAARQAKAGRAA